MRDQEKGRFPAAVRLAVLLILFTMCAVLQGCGKNGRAADKSGEGRTEEEISEEEEYEEEEDSYSSSKWNYTNTVDFDGQIYGFDHRIESFLLIGTDKSGEAGAGKGGGGMADFLMLLVMDYTDDAYGALQIDRNTIATVYELDDDGSQANMRDQQICTAHFYGKDPEMSARNTVDSVKELLGNLYDIDGYYVLNMEDIATLNDSVGGVEVTVKQDLTPSDPALTEGATLTLNGDQAVHFLRSRMSLSDATNKARMSRQTQYMDSLFKQIGSRAKSDPQFGIRLWETMKNAAVSDMNGNAFSRIANMFFQGEDRGILQIDGKTKVGKVLDDGLEHEEFYPDTESVRDAMCSLYSMTLVEDM